MFPRTILAGGAAGLVTAAIVGGLLAPPAQADDHPTIFTFEAHRTSGAQVSYSGRYAVWDGSSGSYVRAEGITVELEQYVPAYAPVTGSPWDEFGNIRPNAAGEFSGVFDAYPGETLRANASDFEDLEVVEIATTASLDIPYYGPMPTLLEGGHAYRPKGKRTVYVEGEADAQCMVNPDDFGWVSCPLAARVHLQSKIKGKWKDVGLFKRQGADSGLIGVLTVKKPKSTTWRFFLPGDRTYRSSTSKAFTTTSKPPLN